MPEKIHDPVSEKNKPKPDHLIEEYHEVISNMRHWDNVGWATMAFSLGFISIMIRFLIENIKFADLIFVVSLIFIICCIFIVRVLFKISEPRYLRAIQIEKELGLKQYHMVDEWKQKEIIMGRFQKPFLFIIVAYIFLTFALICSYLAIKNGIC